MQRISENDKHAKAKAWLEERFPRRVMDSLISINTDFLYNPGPYFGIATDGDFSRGRPAWKPLSLAEFFTSQKVHAFSNVTHYHPQDAGPAPQCLLISATELATHLDQVKAAFDDYVARVSAQALTATADTHHRRGEDPPNLVRPDWTKKRPSPETLSDSAASLLRHYFGGEDLGRWKLNAKSDPPKVIILFPRQEMLRQNGMPSRMEIMSFFTNVGMAFEQGLSTYLKRPCDTVEIAVADFNKEEGGLRVYLNGLPESAAYAAISAPNPAGTARVVSLSSPAAGTIDAPSWPGNVVSFAQARLRLDKSERAQKDTGKG